MVRKNGRFLLVTEDRRRFPEDLAVVLSTTDFNGNHCSSAKAVYIDTRLEQRQKYTVQDICLRHGVPYFFWEPVTRAREDDRTLQDPLCRLLRDQLEFSHKHLSPANVDKIRLQTLIDIITTTNSLLQPNEVMHSVMTQIHELIACEAWSVLLLSKKIPSVLTFAAAHGPNKDRLKDLKVPFGQGIAGWVAEYGEPIIVDNAQRDPRFLSEIDKDTHFVTRNILCAPLISRGRTLGVIEMLNRQDADGFSEDDLELLQILVNPAAVAIDNAYLFQRAQTLTIQDDLTKLYNSRHLNHCLEEELRRAKEENKPLSLLFLDLDGFKAINDNFGHLQGSQSLVTVSKMLRETTRPTDIVGRYGGDEFVVILPETTVNEALRVGESIRSRISDFRLKHLQLTASIGIATFPDHGHNKETLVSLADRAMYWVKENGKNGVISANKLDG